MRGGHLNKTQQVKVGYKQQLLILFILYFYDIFCILQGALIVDHAFIEKVSGEND